MLGLFRISANTTFRGPFQASPDALRSSSCGAPPGTATVQVSHSKRSLTVVYARREPSGEKTGVIFAVLSVVSWIGSPFGSCLTKTWPKANGTIGYVLP